MLWVKRQKAATSIKKQLLWAKRHAVTLIKKPSLWDAARNGNSQDVERLVGQGVNAKAKEWTGVTALHYASQKGKLAIVKFLVDQGKADVNAKDMVGETPLHWASSSGRFSVVQFLVEQGCDVHHKNFNGHTARDIALQKNKLVVAEYLEKLQGPQPQQHCSQFMPLKDAHDVFLVHTGKGGNKADLAFPMKKFMEQRGLSCFLDSEMKKAVPPNKTMQANLECCRHVVAVVSKAFLEQPCPCAELIYAFDKMEWLREQEEMGEKGWKRSLWIVLYDVSVKEYKQARVASGNKLPPLPAKLQMFLYNKGDGKYHGWDSLCDAVITNILHADEDEGAQQKWTDLLLGSHPPASFPLAPEDMYEKSREEAGCCRDNFFRKAHPWSLYFPSVFIFLLFLFFAFLLVIPMEEMREVSM